MLAYFSTFIICNSHLPIHIQSNPAHSHSDMDTDHFDFEFPTLVSDPSTTPASPSDIVFCGKVMGRQSQPDPLRKGNNSLVLRSDSFRKPSTSRSDRFITPSKGENRYRRSNSCRKHRNGLFGILKFPVEMELSEMKMRQGRREPAPLPKLPESGGGDWVSGGDGGKSCWELVRPLRRRGPLMTVLAKASFGCIPLL